MSGIETKNLRNYSLEQVEYFYQNGVVSQAQWEAYAHIWRTSCFRFSGLLDLYVTHPSASSADVLAEIDAAGVKCCAVRHD